MAYFHTDLHADVCGSCEGFGFYEQILESGQLRSAGENGVRPVQESLRVFLRFLLMQEC